MVNSSIFCFVWFAFGVWGLVTGSDTAWIIGLLGSTIHAAAINVMQFIKKENN